MRSDAPIQSSGIHKQNGFPGSVCRRWRDRSWKCCCQGWGGGISRKRCHSKWQPRVAAVLANRSLLGHLLGGRELSVQQSQPCLLQNENNSLVSDTAPADTASWCPQASPYRSRGWSIASSALMEAPQA